MDKISEFFKELKDRFSNPLFFSFAIGWLAFNWQIVIGLFFYSIPELEKDGYSSYFDLIFKSSSLHKTFLYPFGIALGYTFIFPIIRNLISMFNAWNQKWGTEKTLKISAEGKISVSKYIQLREVYEKRRLVVEEVLEKESSHVIEIEKLKSEITGLRNQLLDAQGSLKIINENNDINRALNGEWEIKARTPSAIENKRVIISNRIMFENEDYVQGAEFLSISNFAFNNYTNELIVVFNDNSLGAKKSFTEVFNVRDRSFRSLKNVSNKGMIIEMKRDDLL